MPGLKNVVIAIAPVLCMWLTMIMYKFTDSTAAVIGAAWLLFVSCAVAVYHAAMSVRKDRRMVAEFDRSTRQQFLANMLQNEEFCHPTPMRLGNDVMYGFV